MRVLTLTLAALALIAPMAAQAQELDDKITYVRADDPVMKAAVAEARRRLPEFLAHLANPAPGERGFTIKYDLLPEPDKGENIWVDVISSSPGFILGRLANVPLDPRFKLGEKVTVAHAEILDWGYIRDGVMQGNFTTRALLPRYSPEEADQIRKAYGW